MISQAIPQTKLPSIVELGNGVSVEGGQGLARAGIGSFSAILAGLGQQVLGNPAAPGDAFDSETPLAGQAGEAPASGKQAAAIAATGKFLPPVLPVLATPAGEGGDAPQLSIEMSAQADAGSEEQGVVTGDVACAAALTVLAAPVVTEATASPAPAPASDTVSASTRPLPQAAAAALPSAAGKDGEAASAAGATPRGEAASGASVALHVAPQAGNGGDRPAQRDPSGETRGEPERAAKLATKAAPETASAQFTMLQSAPAQTAAAAPVAAQAASGAERPADGAQPFTPARPSLETQVARELGRIVDSLASAREALSAGTATLAVSHDEFGELSLRFDQRRDGQLAVQISAADPEAHRAVAAAVAERPAFAQSDAGGANGQQGQSAPGGAGRGAAAERDGSGAGNHAARQERGEQPQRGQARSGATDTGGDGRPGIYA